MPDDLLNMQNITKVYGNGIVANQHVDFTVRQGEIHALAGENGAGKSTLMKVLFGIETPDEGQILLNGEPVSIKSPNHAIEHGIGMVHQHFMLVPSLTVAENMIMGMEPGKMGFIDYHKARQITRDVAKTYDLLVDPDAVVSSLPVGMKQRVEILKALARGVSLLILDEPTAVLTPHETDELFSQLLEFKKQGNTIIFISHRLNEIKQLCDRITIMRAGKSMGTYNVAEVTPQEISRLMVGRDVMLTVEKDKAAPGKKVLEVEALSLKKGEKQVLNKLSFAVREGEILGIAGVEGNGQTELIDLICGKTRITDGDIKIQGKSIKKQTVRGIRALGEAHIPEDRMVDGIAADATISENVIANRVDDECTGRGILIHPRLVENIAKTMIDEYRIRCDGPQQTVGMLSGGNIQKVVVARELAASPKLIVANQPTRGVDVSAAEFIHNRLLKLRDENSAVLMISADLNEVLEMSDSLLVMHDGAFVAYFSDCASVKEEELGLYMLGVKRMAQEEIMEVTHEEG